LFGAHKQRPSSGNDRRHALESAMDTIDDNIPRRGVTPFLEEDDFPPRSATVDVTFGARTCQGHSRTVNADHYVVLRMGRHQETLLTSLPDDAMGRHYGEYGYAMVVADGIGGNGAGEDASHLALTTLVYLVRRFGKWNLRIDDAIARDIMARAEWFYRHVDSAVVYHRYQGKNPGRGAQTTLTATFGAGQDLFFAHVGHSRAYLCRHGELMRLTRDHTVAGGASSAAGVAPLIDVNASARDLRHILTDTIGMAGAIGPVIDLERIRVEDDDRVLVCTNGLSDTVDEPTITEILSSDEPPERQSQALIDLVVASKGEDDATALVARYNMSV